jgi:hypothetical protein
MNKHFLAALAASTCLVALTAPVGAQAVAPGVGPTQPAQANAAPGEAETAEIIVTGSRVSRRDFQSDSPISTISASAIAAAGSPSLGVSLGQMPQFAAFHPFVETAPDGFVIRPSDGRSSCDNGDRLSHRDRNSRQRSSLSRPDSA